MSIKTPKIYLTLVLAFIYLLLISLQGFDLADEGYSLSFYQQFFEHPDSVKNQFVFYLTGLFGGIWSYLFGSGGIYSFRILNALIIILTAFFTYQTLKEKVSYPVFIIATFTVILLTNFGNIVFHHNFFTAFLVSIVVFLLLSGIKYGKSIFIFYGSLILGITFFVRIANPTLLALGLLLIIDLMYTKDWAKFWKYVLYSLAGCITGILIVLGVMYFLGHLQLFYDALGSVFQSGTESESNHNLSKLLSTYTSQYYLIFKVIVVYTLLYVLYIFIFRLLKNNILRILIIIFTYLLLCFLCFQINPIIILYGLILFVLIKSGINNIKDKSFVFLASTGLIIMFFFPLGSDFGIASIGYNSVWLGSMLTVAYAYKYAVKKKQEKDYSIITFFGISIFAFCSFNMFQISNYAYFDPGPRIEKFSKINHKLVTVYTTQKKSEIMNQLLDELSNYVKKGDKLLCFESLPAIHYLTETSPYAGPSWVWVSSQEKFKRNLIFAESQSALRPVVLRQKCQPIGGKWTVYDERYNNIELEDSYLYKKGRVIELNDFLKRNNYKVVWENDLFQILTASPIEFTINMNNKQQPIND